MQIITNDMLSMCSIVRITLCVKFYSSAFNIRTIIYFKYKSYNVYYMGKNMEMCQKLHDVLCDNHMYDV